MGVAQLAEHLTVAQDVAGSNPVTHPSLFALGKKTGQSKFENMLRIEIAVQFQFSNFEKNAIFIREIRCI